MAIVKIQDDFDPAKIAESGQCFRAKEIHSGLYRFVTQNHVVYIKRLNADNFDVSCTPSEWEDIWTKYFDLETNYREIREEIYYFGTRTQYTDYLQAAQEYGAGIRILRQDPFETLISFIISQRKTIPAIRKSVELICEQFGKKIQTEHEELYLFPTPEKLSKATVIHLSTCALGYRAAYVHDAVSKVNEQIVRLDEMYKMRDDDMLEELKHIKGVGMKIANCVALYAFHRLHISPVDVWIKRAITEDFHGENIFAECGAHAGVLQQYIFYYKRLGDKEFGMMG